MRMGPVALVGMLTAGCLEHQRGYMSIEDNPALTVNAPSAERCARYKRGTAEATGCTQVRQTAIDWTRKLNVGDEFCVDNTFGDDVSHACKARGVLTDAGADGFIVEIRDARSDSSYFAYNQRRIWFATGAMIDRYVKERGYE